MAHSAIVHRTTASALQAIHDEYTTEIRNRVKELLEQKHLYQSVTVNVGEIARRNISLCATSVPGQSELTPYFSTAANWGWRLVDDFDLPEKASEPFEWPKQFSWLGPDIKTFCFRCDRVEAFNLVRGNRLVPHLRSTATFEDTAGAIQAFSLSYICQACKVAPEVFLLRRHGQRISLCGRAPIEAVKVAKFIPAEIKKYVSGSRVAYQSGQPLAALFLLRTACEQWCRKFADPTDRADVAIEKYCDSLPDDFKQRFPSLKSIYSDLSAAIHSASENAELFEAQSNALHKHFEARKLYDLDT